MKKIEKIKFHSEQQMIPVVESKVNELIDRVNEITERLFPGWETKENKGYENEPFDNKIGDPNDR